MSDFIKHECGIAVVRLLKPLDYYHQKYGTAMYGLNKLYLLMQKQHNRGQDGAGVATIKLDPEPGTRFVSRYRSTDSQPIKDIFQRIFNRINEVPKDKFNDIPYLKANVPVAGELLLGHLRYGTHGKNGIETCHPVFRQSNWIMRNLLLAGNFNLTNVSELFGHLYDLGQHPKEQSDTVTILEKIGHFLDDEVQRMFHFYNTDYSDDEGQKLTQKISEELDIQRILTRATRKFDGGFALAGLIGNGDAFVMRDQSGIRPAFYYKDEEVVVVASERPAIQTAFDVHISTIKEIDPGHAVIIKKDGQVSEVPVMQPAPRNACSFERIYFSRGNDKDIYNERKKLGEQLADRILKCVDYDFQNTVFSFIPNTAEIAFYGLVEGLEQRLNDIKKEKILAMGDNIKPKKLEKILSLHPRVEKIAVKDIKLRTFITEDSSRDDLVSHVYDVTYGIVRNHIDTLVLLDDSIVRGTTLKQSILKIVARLKPKKIVIVSSAPQICFPDCYGIDMSKVKDFVAFRAMIALIKEHNKEHLLTEVYERCKASMDLPIEEVKNEVQLLFEQFTQEEISKKIAKIITPKGVKQEVEVIYQSVEGLHQACPYHKGDWYFTGNYPTPGGNRVANKSFVFYMENKDIRAY